MTALRFIILSISIAGFFNTNEGAHPLIADIASTFMRDFCAEDFAKKVKEKFYPCRPSPPEKFKQMIDESIKNSEEAICKGIIKDVKMQLGNSKMQDLEDNLTKATLKDEKSKIPMFLDKSGFKEIVKEAVKREINNPTRFNLPAMPANPCKKNQKYSIN